MRGFGSTRGSGSLICLALVALQCDGAAPRRKASFTAAFKAAAAAPPVAFDARAAALAQPPRYDAPRLCVPLRLAAAEIPPAPPLHMFGLDDLFPGAGLGQAFEDASFRKELRLAARKDLAAAGAAQFDRLASAQGCWVDRKCDALAAALRAAGPNAPAGEAFIATLTSLALPSDADRRHRARVGHWIEIVNSPHVSSRKQPHAWHQDRAGDGGALTVMLGFPAAAAVGAGVFSHVVQLSHTILPDAAIPISAPRTFDLLSDLGCTTGAAEQLVVRPAFARGSEVLAYADSLTVHSAPDVIHRDALWRFM